MKTLYLLTDYRKSFYSNVTKERIVYSSLDINNLKNIFAERGWDLKVMRFSDIDFLRHPMRNNYVLYQSSEDIGGLYKSYIDDVIYALHIQGAKLMPHYHLFKAHHNKVFMELLRPALGNAAIQSPASKVFGVYEELPQAGEILFPAVIKSAEGAGSYGVKLAKNYADLLIAAKQLSSTFNVREWLSAIKLRYKGIASRITPHSLHRRKFIIQQFIPSLEGDFKVLVFNDKYYVLYRRNRKDDFRASGSGLFEWPANPPEGLLDFAKACFDVFDAPCASFDIGYDGKKFHLIEFQFLSFGPLTLVGSKQFFSKKDNCWEATQQESDYPAELANAILAYIERKDIKEL